MKKTMIGFAICVLLLGCSGCGKEKEVDIQGTGIEPQEDMDGDLEMPDRLTQSEVTDSENSKKDELEEGADHAP